MTFLTYIIVLLSSTSPNPIPYHLEVQRYEVMHQQHELDMKFYALADCETGQWLGHGAKNGFEAFSADWHYASGYYQGGLQFDPRTWKAFKPTGYPDNAYNATVQQQMVVGRRVVRHQGWKAWPVCSRKLGYRS